MKNVTVFISVSICALYAVIDVQFN